MTPATHYHVKLHFLIQRWLNRLQIKYVNHTTHATTSPFLDQYLNKNLLLEFIWTSNVPPGLASSQTFPCQFCIASSIFVPRPRCASPPHVVKINKRVQHSREENFLIQSVFTPKHYASHTHAGIDAASVKSVITRCLSSCSSHPRAGNDTPFT